MQRLGNPDSAMSTHIKSWDGWVVSIIWSWRECLFVCLFVCSRVGSLPFAEFPRLVMGHEAIEGIIQYLPSTKRRSITERILTGKGSKRTFSLAWVSYALRTTETVVTLTRLPFGRFCFYHVICVDMRILLTGALKNKNKQTIHYLKALILNTYYVHQTKDIDLANLTINQ